MKWEICLGTFDSNVGKCLDTMCLLLDTDWAEPYLQEIETFLSGNNQWYCNLAAEWAYTHLQDTLV